MKKAVVFLLVLVVLFSIGFFFFRFATNKVKSDLALPIPYPSITTAPTPVPIDDSNAKEYQSLFVPYWGLEKRIEKPDQYNSYLYFGVAPTQNGLNTKETGYTRIDAFFSLVPSESEKVLVIRMIESDTNFAVLKDVTKQNKVITESVLLAKAKGFDGIVLDLEVSAIPFDSLVKQISAFSNNFSQEVRKQQLSYGLAIYGDVFYRIRPFDVKELSKNADTLYIMAYDFSKAKGNPGPNFPLNGEELYGYDYKQMASDFLAVVPTHKVTVVFGLFGYDWRVNTKGNSIQQGKAITSAEVEADFIVDCKQRSCSFSREQQSFEIEVNYTGKDGSKHSIWFEDEDSVAAKKAYLKSRGINSFSYWAHSYF
ncbi:MAG TPA: glycosyl hydrolase family 18 protein [Patescibacteria group bacterium]|nr:glycosyl hydrolase family 18 protein [Patescibacteria group bacterium]